MVQDSDFGTAERPRFPYLLVGLYMGVYALAERYGLQKALPIVGAETGAASQ